MDFNPIIRGGSTGTPYKHSWPARRYPPPAGRARSSPAGGVVLGGGGEAGASPPLTSLLPSPGHQAENPDGCQNSAALDERHGIHSSPPYPQDACASSPSTGRGGWLVGGVGVLANSSSSPRA